MKKCLIASLVAFSILGAVIGDHFISTRIVHAQTSNPFPELDKFGRVLSPRWTSQIVYSPNDLQHNAVTLPASAATTNTNIVRVGQAKELTYLINCTQNTTVTINVYTADDTQSNSPAWALFGSFSLFTAVPSGGSIISIATELAPNATPNLTPVSVVRLPLAAVSFNETNATATPGTCTGRLNVGYN